MEARPCKPGLAEGAEVWLAKGEHARPFLRSPSDGGQARVSFPAPSPETGRKQG